MMVLNSTAGRELLSRTHVCPLCPLHCDDVRVDTERRLVAEGCPIVKNFPSLRELPADRGETALDWGFFLAGKPRANSVNAEGEDAEGEDAGGQDAGGQDAGGQDAGGKDAGGQDAGGKDAACLRVVTTGVDLATARRLTDLQSNGRIELTIESDPSVQAILDVASRDGIVSATLADLAVHADVVWMIGAVEATWPRITEKLRRSETSRDDRSLQRFANCSAAELTEFAAAVRENATASDPGNSGADRSGPLAGAAEQWRQARYGAILVGPGAFALEEEAIAATMLARLVRQQNASSRSVLVTLDAAATLRSVSLWKTNTVPACGSPGSPADHVEISDQMFDVRIGSPWGEQSRAARIQFGGRDLGVKMARAYRRGSVAGLHRRGMVIRGDGSVSLPLDPMLATR